MIPVYQAQLVPPEAKTSEDIEALPGHLRGDCLRACFASIFELPLNEVPHFVAEDDWFGCLQDWLADFGLYTICHPIRDFTPWKGVWVVGGDSPRHGGQHAVVAEYGFISKERGWGWQVIHDPHPSNEGLKGEPLDVFQLICFNPARRASGTRN